MSKSTLSTARPLASAFDQSPLPRKLFLIALILGTVLRIIAGLWGDIGVYVDGASRIALAMRWAEHPEWRGLSGVWPAFHIYFLGALIRLWNQPIILAKLVGFICGVAAIFAFRNAVRHSFGIAVASLAAVFLAIYWTHIWLTSSYWVEVPYILFVLLAVNYAEAALRTPQWKSAFLSGLFLSLGILLRNEALLLLIIFALWHLIVIRDRQVFLTFVILPGLLMAWILFEPTLYGQSYFGYFSFVSKSKEIENLIQGISRKDCLVQWIMMLSATPTLLIVLPGLYVLWQNRRWARSDLFAWMFIAQFGFYFFLTLSSAWRPQLRYLMLCFVNLFPYAALTWLRIMQRFPTRYVLVTLLALIIGIQSLGWWIGRNNRLPGGWLPLQVITSSQTKLDKWIKEMNAESQRGMSIMSIVPGPMAERWSLDHSFVVNRMMSGGVILEEFHVQVEPQILSGIMPDRLYSADLILIAPDAVFYPTVVSTITQRKPELVIKKIHHNIAAILLTERARTELKFISGTEPSAVAPDATIY